MLELHLHKADGQRVILDMLPDSSLALESTSPFFDEQLDEGTFSYPLDVPWTEHNCKELGAPEMLESVGQSGLLYWIIDVYEAGIPVMSEVKLTILGHKGSYDYRRGTYTMTVSGNESVFGTRILGKTLQDLRLGGGIDMGSPNGRQWAYNRMAGFLPQYDYIRFAPVYWPDYIDTTREDYTTEFIAGDIVNQIVINPIYPFGWKFGRPDPANPTSAVIEGNAYYPDHRTVPFFSLHYVLRSVFKENGYEAYGSFLDDPDYANLMVFNNCALEIYNSAAFDINRSIYPKKHMPNITISAFLIALRSFGIVCTFAAGKKVEIKYQEDLLASREITNITNQTIDAYEADKPTVATGGLKLSFGWDDKDSFHSDRVKDVDLTRLKYSLALATDLAALTTGLSDGDLAYVIAENYYYEWRYGVWTFLSEGLQDKIIGNGENEFPPHISPLCQLSQYYIDGTLAASDMVATRQKGTYYNNNKALVSEDVDLRIFYIKSLPAFGITGPGLPTSFSHNYDPINGTKRVATSLSWTAPNSLYDRHHRRWIDMQLQGWSVQASFDIKSYQLDLLQFGKKVQIRNVQYVVQQVLPIIGKGDPVGAVLMKI